MDTSGLASSLSLGAFLLAFGYLSLVEEAVAYRSAAISSSKRSGHPSLILGSLRLGSLVAVVLSALALLLGQSSPGIALIAVVALDLLAFLVALDRATRLLSRKIPGLASALASPFQVPLLHLMGVSKPEDPVSGGQARSNGKDHVGDGLELTDSATVVITEEEQATLDARERFMIRSILRLDESSAREIMVPRVDIVAVDAETLLPEVARRMLECGHSRFPVYSETVDNVIGVVYSRDLLPFLGKVDEYPPLEQIIRAAFFIPESKRLDELLKELQEKRVQMAMVVDEYGGIEGLVTLEDLIEEIVGEIEDEFSRSLEPRVMPLSDGDVIVDARVTLDYLSDLFSIHMGEEEADTVGGLVYSALGKMPQVGDKVMHNGLSIEVVSLLGRRIRKLKLSRT